jgi:hypothetical protein
MNNRKARKTPMSDESAETEVFLVSLPLQTLSALDAAGELCNRDRPTMLDQAAQLLAYVIGHEASGGRIHIHMPGPETLTGIAFAFGDFTPETEENHG